MRTIQDIVKLPGAIVTQPFHLEIATVDSPLSVFDFESTEEMNKPYLVKITVTSTDKHIDGAACVGRPAVFTIDEHASVPSLQGLVEPAQVTARTLHGIVTQWTRVKISRDEAMYQAHLRPRLALLEEVHDSGVFLDRSLPELLTDLIVDRDLFESYDLDLQLEGLDDKVEQTVMYEETVANCIDRHCRRKGAFYYFTQADRREGPQRETLVVGNTPSAYRRALEIPLLPNSGLVSWHEAILELEVERNLVPQVVREWDHNYRVPDDPLQVESSVAEDDRSVYGSVNRSNEHFHSVKEGQALADVRRDELIARQTQIRGTSNVLGMMPGMVVHLTNDTIPEAPHGFVITKLVSKGSRRDSVTNIFEAIPAHLTFRPDYVPAKHWRWVSGTLIGTIESGDDEPYAWLDEYGRYRVKFQFARRTGKRGLNSMPLRLLRTSASYQGGLHSPLLPQTEVRIEATNADIDRLYIAGALHDYARTDPVHGKEGWYSRAVWRSPLRGNKIRFEDLKEHEGIKIGTVFAKSSVSLGYLVDGEKKKRGEGVEIGTQAWASLHGPKGVFLSADPWTPNAPHLDMPAAVAQLKAALQRVTDLAAATTQARAEPADHATQAALLDGLNQLRDAGLLASAPGGMAFVTPKSAQHSAGENVIVTAGQDMDISVVKRLRMVAGDLFSLCAHKLGIKIFSKGKIEMQAQGAAMDLFADRTLHVSSASGDVLVDAKTKAMMASGGASMTIENGSVVFTCPGEFRIRAASFTFEGPGNTALTLPQLPVSNYQPNARYSHTR
ncbi:type VI secretion system tip protein VgrG [Burkholderia pseudomultivorans]|uniref:type VI secretion system Vgr family protein n=1 Tax=Burkholderia pseudomultivorans TaxID=1207504 RepID=UPI00084224BA|nr:type VI secretion system tip protein VgrG [Burkholderia pseudomultivorans]AOI90145.1 type IV secretion protein Rhs [Burkholderia pseudomultivorans]MDS0794252.1 type VI secretion system tip protein VgrG [Burkholderia pseudomultivorans]